MSASNTPNTLPIPDFSDKKFNDLTKLTDDGDKNSFDEYATKAQSKFDSYGLWRFIKGPDSVPPSIPRLKKQQQVTGKDPAGNDTTIIIPGNENAVLAARTAAIPWMNANKKALSLIVESVPANKLFLIAHLVFASEAWAVLEKEYRPVNAAKATRIKQDIMCYRCMPGYDVGKWRADMLTMFAEIKRLEANLMPDSEFARHLVVLMPKDGDWRYISSQLFTEYTEGEAKMKPISSTYILEKIQGEKIRQDLDSGLTSSGSTMMLARAEHEAKTSKKRSRDEPLVAQASVKRHRSDKVCTNQYCARQNGHLMAECFAYTGGKEGQYAYWYTGPKDIHLPPAERKLRREEKQKAANTAASVNQTSPQTPPSYSSSSTTTFSPSTSRTTPSGHTTTDSSTTAHANLAEANHFVFNTSVADQCSPLAFNTTLSRSADIFHDSGASRHVFNDKSVFHTYTDFDTPLRINGFDSNVSAHAPGQGTIVLRSVINGTAKTVTLHDVLYVPNARVNLVSASVLDEKGCTMRSENGRIQLMLAGQVFAEGVLFRGLYKLKLDCVPPSRLNPTPAPTLSERIAPRPLAERIGGMSAMNAAINAFNAEDRGGFYTA